MTWTGKLIAIVRYPGYFLLFVVLFPCIICAQKQFYVSLKGNDVHPGTIEKPFATLEKARLAIRSYVKLHPCDTVTVFLRNGTYRFGKSFRLDSLDSGHNNAPIIYSSYPGEIAIFNGGVSFSVSKAIKTIDKKILDRIIPAARNNILQLNLKALGIKDYGTIVPKGFGRPYSVAAMELFCNGQAMRLARWPNDSMVPIGKVLDPGSIPQDGDTSHRGGVFIYNESRPDSWLKTENDIWISGFFRYGFADDAVEIARLDKVNKTITTAQETLYGFESGKYFQRWFAFNLLEEIDEPGEYYIDRKAGILYFYPPVNILQSIDLSVLETPILSLLNASHVIFRNIIFENSRGMGIYIEKGNENRIENCTIRNVGIVGVCIGKGIKPIEHFYSAPEPASEILGSLHVYSYGNTVFNREGGFGHVISDCHIYNTGSGGISLSGGNRVTLEAGNNQVVDCLIHNCNRLERALRAGINIDGAGNIIRNNEIYNCPWSAIYLHGNNHLIERNKIHDAATEGDDVGAIYYGRDPSEFGNKVVNNFFHHIGNDHGMIVTVYHDDGACGMEVAGNIFYKAGSITVIIGGGNDNVCSNNIFIDCPLAFHVDARLTNGLKEYVTENGLFKERLNAVNYTQPPYAIYYPNLLNYFKDSVGFPKRNFIGNNVFVNVNTIYHGEKGWASFGDNFITSDDPGFIDAAAMNFGLKDSSIVYRKLPGFRPIPFEAIGIHKSNKKTFRQQQTTQPTILY